MKFQFRLPFVLIITVLLMLQLPASSASIGTDNTNNSPATAETLVDGSSITAGMDFIGDVDYYNFSVTAATGVRIWTTTADQGHDTYLRLYDSTGLLLVENDDFNDTLQSNLNVFLQPGNYYVTMRAYADDSTYQGYTIYLRFISFSDISNEDNDDYTTATNLTGVGRSNNEIVNGDPDWFYFSSASGVVEIMWDKPVIDNVYIDVYLYRDDAGSLVFVDFLGVISDWESPRDLYRYVDAGVVYYLEIIIYGLGFS
ncbi:MAG: hypothetical protein ACXAE3_10575, partial [Candidatus Kariarchaeaceae archaeon]